MLWCIPVPLDSNCSSDYNVQMQLHIWSLSHSTPQLKCFCSPCCLTATRLIPSFSTCCLWCLIKFWHGWPQHFALAPWICTCSQRYSSSLASILFIWMCSYLETPGLNGFQFFHEFCKALRTPCFILFTAGIHYFNNNPEFLITLPWVNSS